MATTPVLPFWQFTDPNSRIYRNAKAYWYESGTSNQKAVYTDAGLTTPHPQPVPASGNGFFPLMFLEAGLYRLVLHDENDVPIPDCEADPVSGAVAAITTDGGTLTGFLTLHADPVQPMHAATKSYVDGRGTVAESYQTRVADDTTTATTFQNTGLSISYSPQYADSTLEIEAWIPNAASTTTDNVSPGALFRIHNSTASASGPVSQFESAAAGTGIFAISPVVVFWRVAAGSTAARTFVLQFRASGADRNAQTRAATATIAMRVREIRL